MSVENLTNQKEPHLSRRVKFAVYWFLFFHIGGSIIGSAFIINELQDPTKIGAFLAGAIPVGISIVVVCYGVWNLKKWAKIPLYVIIIVDLVFGVIPSFEMLFSGNPEYVVIEIFVFGAFGVNFYTLYELKKALGITSRFL